MLSAIRTNCIMYFYPRSPCGERRYWPCVHVVGRSISIHALLAESDTDEVLTNDEQTISIHALLAESDLLVGLGFGSMDISIHALLAESDLPSSHSFTARAGISIHALLAESDGPLTAACTAWCNFYPRSPCGERRRVHYGQRRHPDFYPRSPCGERPQAERRRDEAKADFYPRSPCGERRAP